MVFVPQFDMAALFIEALLIFFILKKRNLPVLQNRVFLILAIDLIFITCLDWWTTAIDFHQIPFPRPLIYFLNWLYLSITASISTIYLFYCLSLVDYWKYRGKKQNRKVFNFIVGFYLCLVIYIGISPLIPVEALQVFYLDKNNIYQRGGVAFLFLYFYAGVYMLATLVVLLKFRTRISKAKIIMMIVYIVTTGIAVLIQLLVPGLLVECFGLSLCAMCFLFFVQRPEEFVDGNLEIFNYRAFTVMEAEFFRTERKHVCIGIIIDDMDFLYNTFGIKQIMKIMIHVSAYLRLKFSTAYTLGKNMFCIVLNNPDGITVDTAVSMLKTRFKGTWEDESFNQKLYARFCVIDCNKDVNSAEDIMDIMNLVTTDERYKMPVIYSKDVDLSSRKEIARIEHFVRNGLSENLFEIYYQPIYSTEDKRIIGAEALIRLRDDEGKFINPEVFVPIAEKNGTILRIGEFVFESVCKTLSKLNLRKLGIKKIDVNLSVAQCMQETLADQIKTIRTIYQVPVSVLNLEITESASAHNPEILLNNMKELDEAGFELSMDDYGSGYSNMGYMLNLPFKMIKIDKFIVWAAFKDEKAKIALIQTIKMIKSIGLSVLAEGVETKEQLEWLSEVGCDYLQGYYFSKALPVEDFIKLLEENARNLPDTETVDNIDSVDDIEELEEI